MTVDTDKLFGEDYYWDEALHEIRHEDYEGATNIVNKLEYNEGWYNYSSLRFDLKGKRYSIEYREHTSDNVSDFEWIDGTFIELGSVEEMEETITKEDLAFIKNNYEKNIKHLEQYRDVLRELRTISKHELTSTGKMLIEINADADEKDKKGTFNIGVIGEFLVKYAQMRSY